MSIKFCRLTRATIRALKPGKSITEHGITAERLSDGDTRYSVNVMVDGERIHRTIGTESAGTTRHQAEQFIEQVRSDARADRLSLPKGRKLALSFAKAADDYIARLEQSGGRNLEVKRQHLRDHLNPTFGTMRLDAIKPFAVERYKREKRSAGLSAATINRTLATLSHLFGRAVEWEWIDRIPARPKMLDEGNGRIVALSDEETGRLIQAAGASYDTDLILFVQIALGTSMRHGEILRVRWEHLDLANRRLYIPQAKAGARTQPITVSLADTLTREREMRVDRTGWIFPSRYRNSTIGHRESFEHSFRRAVIDAGLDPRVVTPHTLRHTAVTRLVQAGVDLPTIQAISGHKTIKMVLRYAHVSAPHVDEAMSALDADPVPVTRRAVSH